MRKMKRLRNAVMLSMLTTSVVWGGTAFANAADLQEFDLDTMVVTASRVETAKVDTPANVSVVTAEKIENRHYQNVAEALKDVPGATVLDSGKGAYEKTLALNGDERVLVLVDGRRVNNEMGPTSGGRASYDFNQLPDVSIIDRIEVVKGHGGALYGSDAVGGVINIITKKMDHSFGKVAMGFGSNQSRDAKAMYSIKEGKTGIMVAASKYKQGYFKYKDVADGDTKRWAAPSDYNNEKVSLKVSQELTEKTALTVGYDYSKFDGFSPSDAKNLAENRTDKKTTNIYAKYDWTVNEADDGYLQVYHNKLDYYNQGGMESKDYGFDAQQALNTSENNKIVFGTSYRKSKATNDKAYAAGGDINNISVFVNDIWEFIPDWSLNTGARYDKHSKFGSKSTLSAGLNKKFDENSHAYLNWGQVFKAPNIDNLYYDNNEIYPPSGTWRGSKIIYKGNPDLKPEKGDIWTLGYSTIVGEKTKVDINCFYSNLNDAIEWKKSQFVDPTDPAYDVYLGVAENIHKQKKNGMELSVNHELDDNWDLEASYSYVRVRNDNNDGQGFVRDVNYVPNIYRLGVRYHNDLWNADLFLRAGSGADTNRINSGSYYKSYVDSSYVTLDASVSYKATKDLSFYAKGYNLFNKAYAESAGVSGASYKYPAQSRRFIIGAEYSF